MKKGVKIGLISSSMLFSMNSFGEGSQLKFYGSVGAGILMHSIGKAATDDTAVATQCAADGSCGGSKAVSHIMVSPGYYSNKFGVDVTANPEVMAKLELETGMHGESVTPRKFFVKTALPFGNLTVGRQDRIFADVAGATDNMLFAAGSLAGTLYQSRNNGIRLSPKAFGPVQVNVGLFHPKSQDQGPVESGMSPMPATELSVTFAKNIVRAGFAYQMEKYSLNNDSASEMPAIMAVNAGVDVKTLSATFALVTGDPIYHSVTKSGKIAKGKKEKITGMSLWAQNDFGMAVVALFYGNEKTTQENSNALAEAASSIGLSCGLKGKDVVWAVEFSNTNRTLKSKKVNDDTYIGLAATYDFKS